MTQNLFLLFILYLFVVQTAIAGRLRKDTNRYILAGINLILILLIMLIYNLCKKEEKSTKSTKEKPEEKENIPSKTVPTTEYKTEYKKPKKSKAVSQRRIFLIALVISSTIVFLCLEFFEERSREIASCTGLIVLIFIGKVFHIRGFNHTFKLWSTRTFIVFIILSAAYALTYDTLNTSKIDGLTDYIKNNYEKIMGENQISTTETSTTGENNTIGTGNDIGSGENGSGYIFNGSGEVLGISYNEGNSSGSTATGTTTGTVQTGTNHITGGNTTGATTPETTPETTQKTSIQNQKETTKITMIDAIKHIIEANKIPLSTKKDITFTYVGSNSNDYSYFKTAYEKKMIGKSTEPSKQISCDTYMVVKGLGEGRNVGSYTDVKVAYWNTAEKLGKLNGCKKGEYVVVATL